MVALQIISKVLNTRSMDIINDNLLTIEYFVGYEEEYTFITEHYIDYGNVPDKASFLSKFPNLELVEVNESDRYLVDTIREEYLYYKSVPVVQKIAELLKTNSNDAVEYMIHSMKELEPNYGVNGTDIINEAGSRFNEYIDRRDHQDEWFFTTGFPELDDLVHALQRIEELFVIFARTNQGKSWILEKICTHVWQLGYNVGYISPEMSASSIGYRFDTLHNHFSNKDLMWGNKELDENSYKEYIDKLTEKKNKFMVATPLDFQQKITISKLRDWVKKDKLDILAIDGITYLTDERGKRGDNKTTSLTNISEDLMMLSTELRIPVIIVVQANRGGVHSEEDDGLPELEHIKDSDGIAHNASKVLSIRQLKNKVLRMVVKKNRFGSINGRLDYQWDIDKGDFVFIPSYDDAEPKEKTERKVEELKRKYTRRDRKEVF